MNYTKLSKQLSYILRHAPEKFGLELDQDGWVGIDELLAAVRKKTEWNSLDEEDIKRMIKVSDKERHQMKNGRIRALYGHSVPQKVIKQADIPPPVLYHGTARKFIDKIMADGLQPMARQYVHLSIDVETAESVGKRRDFNPVILTIDAEKAVKEGISFYRGNQDIWLTDFVPPGLIRINSSTFRT